MTASQVVVSRGLLLALVAVGLVRLVTLGAYPLMDTTEARYAEIARKMVELGDWVTPWFDYGVPFWGKPPLAFWLTAASFKLFGINEFAARLPHFLAALVLVWLIWDWVARRSRREAAYAVALLAGSMLYFVAAGGVMTDTALAVGTTLVMRGFWLGLFGDNAARRREPWLLFLGLAVGLLAKGPVALVLVSVPIALWAFATGNVVTAWRGLPWVRGGLLVLALAAPWYVVAELRTPGFLEYFFIGEHWQRFKVAAWQGDLYGSAHAFPRGSIWLFAFAAVLPWSLLVPVAALRWRKTRSASPLPPAQRQWRLYLLLWGLTPCVFFTFAGNILATYVLPGLPALALAVGAWLAHLPAPRDADRLLTGGLMVTLLLLLGALMFFTDNGRFDAKTAKGLVAAYEARRSGHEKLIFLGKRPFSGAFYSSGKAEQVPDADRLAKRLRHEAAFVALTPSDAQQLPTDLQRTLTRVGRYGSLELFHHQASQHSPDGSTAKRIPLTTPRPVVLSPGRRDAIVISEWQWNVN